MSTGFLCIEEEEQSDYLPASVAPYNDACLFLDRREILSRWVLQLYLREFIDTATNQYKLSLSFSLSLYIYVYIYIYKCINSGIGLSTAQNFCVTCKFINRSYMLL